MAYLRKKIDETLREFGKVGLKPNDTILSDGIKNAQEVFELLKDKSKFDLDRVIIAGSVGKRTAIANFYDFDLVVFVNKTSPPFDEILDVFEGIVSKKENVSSVDKTKHSVQFKIDFFEYDLLPGINFVTEPNKDSDWRINKQSERVLQKIKEDPREAYNYSSSLVECQLGFMKKQSAFVHELVRLCKFWNKTIYIPDYISGRSTIIELIAIHAAGRNQDGNSDTPMFEAFKTFLVLVKDIENMDITFDDVKPATVLTKPLLLEPANPFNNLLDTWKSSTKKLFSEYAKESLVRLENFCNESNLDPFDLAKIFVAHIDPGTLNAIAIGSTLKGPRISNTTIPATRDKTMVVRNKSLQHDQVLRIQKVIETLIFTKIVAAMYIQNQVFCPEGVAAVVGGHLKYSIYRKSPDHVGYIAEKDNGHEQFDMTFSISYQYEGKPYEVKFSFNVMDSNH